MADTESSISTASSSIAQSSDEAKNVTVHICSKPGCGKLANLACPTCIKLGLPPSRFCGQDCFKENWNLHKLVHKVPFDPSIMPPEFKSFKFSGSLRPYQTTSMRSVPSHIPKPDYADNIQGIPTSENNDRRT